MLMLYQDKRPGKGLLVTLGAIATLLLHGGLVAGIWIGRAHADDKPQLGPQAGHFIDVQSVKFGKPRDTSFLPHKEAPQVNKTPGKTVHLTTNAQALPHLKTPEENKKEDDKPLPRLPGAPVDNNAETPKASTEGEGDPNGVRGGSNTVGKGPVYFQHLQAKVQNEWNLDSTRFKDERELSRLKAQACLKIDASGKITEVKIAKGSGNDLFDETLKLALDKIEKFDPPTSESVGNGMTVKDVVTADGICMNFAYKK